MIGWFFSAEKNVEIFCSFPLPELAIWGEYIIRLFESLFSSFLDINFILDPLTVQKSRKKGMVQFVSGTGIFLKKGQIF